MGLHRQSKRFAARARDGGNPSEGDTMIQIVAFSLMFGAMFSSAHTDEVTDWNRILFLAALVAHTAPAAIPRIAAITVVSAFDSVIDSAAGVVQGAFPVPKATRIALAGLGIVLIVIARRQRSLTSKDERKSPTITLPAVLFMRLFSSRIGLCFLLLAARSVRAGETSSEWTDWMLQGKTFAASGRYSDAAHALRQALALAHKAQIGSTPLVELYDALGSAYGHLDHFSDAERQYRMALAVVDRSEGRDSLTYAVLLSSIALLPGQNQHTEEAIRTMRAALKSKRTTASEHDLAVSQRSLAQLLLQQGRYDEAESVLQDAVGDSNKRQSEDQSLLAGALNDMGVLRFQQGRYGESIRILEGAAHLESSYSIIVLNNLAASYVRNGRLKDAELAYQRAIAVAGRTLGEEHRDYGELLANYAVVLRKLGRKHESKIVAARSEKIIQAFNRRNGTDSTVAAALLSSRH
jgi:tetratricopeptide (TPR) repeat protein